MNAASGAAMAVGLGLMPMNTAYAGCSPPGNFDPQPITCDNTTPDNTGGSGYSAGDGNDTINIISGSFAGIIRGGRGDDSITMNAGSIGGDLEGDNGIDTIIMNDGTVSGNVSAGPGTIASIPFRHDIIIINAGSVGGNIEGGIADDSITMNGGTVNLDIRTSQGDDTVTLNDALVRGDLRGGNGREEITVNNATVVGSITTGNDIDRITIDGGSIGDDINTANDIDHITIDRGTIAGNILAGSGNDIATLTAGSVGGGIFMGDGVDTLVVGQDFILSAATVLDGGTNAGGDDFVRIEVVDGGTRSFANNAITAFEDVSIDNQTDPNARGTVTLTGLAIDTGDDGLGGVVSGTTFEAAGHTLIHFANSAATNTIRAETVTFGENTILSGNGTIVSGNASTTFNGTVRPGGFAPPVGTINVTGSATFGTNAVYHADIQTRTSTDLIAVTDTVNLAGDLIVDFFGQTAQSQFDSGLLDTTPALSRITLVTSDAGIINGDFNLIVVPNAVIAGHEWRVFKDGTAYGIQLFVLTVSEPAITAAFGAGLATLVGLRRKRKKTQC